MNALGLGFRMQCRPKKLLGRSSNVRGTGRPYQLPRRQVLFGRGGTEQLRVAAYLFSLRGAAGDSAVDDRFTFWRGERNPLLLEIPDQGVAFEEDTVCSGYVYSVETLVHLQFLRRP